MTSRIPSPACGSAASIFARPFGPRAVSAPPNEGGVGLQALSEQFDEFSETSLKAISDIRKDMKSDGQQRKEFEDYTHARLNKIEGKRSPESRMRGSGLADTGGVQARGGASAFGLGTVATLGASIVESDDFKKFNRDDRSAILNVSTLQAAVNPIGSGSPASSAAFIAPDRIADPILMPRQPLNVRALFRWIPTTSGIVHYPKQIARQLNAATVAELALKPQSDMNFADLNVPVQVIAHWVYVSRQTLDDAPTIRAVIDSELLYGLQLREEYQLLFGNGQSPNLFGVATTAQAFDPTQTFTVPNPTYLDVLLQGVAQVENTFEPATGIVLNPNDYNMMRAVKDGQYRYIGEGPFADVPRTIWDIPWAKSYTMPQGSFLIGAFASGAQGFMREEINTMISFEDRDNFVNNRATILSEERLCLVVKQPSSFVYDTFQAAIQKNNAALTASTTTTSTTKSGS